MFSNLRHHPFILGLALAGFSFAPSSPGQGPPPSPAPAAQVPALARARYDSALRQFEQVWSYYRQSRVESFDVYLWSRLVLDAQQALDKGQGQAEKIAALQAHEKRMEVLESLIKRIRKLGFGRSIDVGACEYYRREAEFWLAQARAG